MVHDGHMTTTQIIVENTLNAGGITIRLADGDMPGDGYMVSLPDSEHVVSVTEFDGRAVRNYVKHYADAFARPDAYLGTWLDAGKVYLDVSVRVCDRDAAIALGHKHAQLAIYDVASSEVITL